MGYAKKQYTNEFGQPYIAEDFNRLELDFKCMAIESFTERQAYHYSPNVRQQMIENVRTLFYELAIEDNLRMGFLKGIILKFAQLEMNSSTDEEYILKFDRLAMLFVKIWIFNPCMFAKFSTEHTYLYAKPTATDILDTRLIKEFVKKCVPLIERLVHLFNDTSEIETLN